MASDLARSWLGLVTHNHSGSATYPTQRWAPGILMDGNYLAQSSMNMKIWMDIEYIECISHVKMDCLKQFKTKVAVLSPKNIFGNNPPQMVP